MKRPIVLGLTALTLAATLSPLSVKASNVDCNQAGNANKVIIMGSNCGDINNIKDQIQGDIQSIIENAIKNNCNNGCITINPGCGTENAPNTDAPNVDAPNTDAPNTDTPNTDAPNTDTPSTDNGNNNNNSTQSSYAQQVVDLVNAERAKEGLAPLNFDVNITNAANIRATEIQSSFSHTRPNGSNFNTVLTEQGISYRSYGENIAYGQKTPQEVVTGWMNSAGHRANIMDKNFKNIGVGYQVKNGTAYWVQLFTA